MLINGKWSDLATVRACKYNWLARLDKYTALPEMNAISFRNNCVRKCEDFYLWMPVIKKWWNIFVCLERLSCSGSFQMSIREIVFGSQYAYNIFEAILYFIVIFSSCLLHYQRYQLTGAVGGSFVVRTFTASLWTAKLSHHLLSYPTRNGSNFCYLMMYIRYIKSSSLQNCQVTWWI